MDSDDQAFLVSVVKLGLQWTGDVRVESDGRFQNLSQRGYCILPGLNTRQIPRTALILSLFAVIDSLTEEYHPRWGARTSNPVKSVNTGLVGSTPASSAKSTSSEIRQYPK
jgi:hypothetical protein